MNHPTHYNSRTVTDSFGKSLKRRIELLWELITLRPCDNWQDEFRNFRRRRTEFVPIEYGEPGYEDAHYQNTFVPRAYEGSFRWVEAGTVDWPDGLGETIDKDFPPPVEGAFSAPLSNDDSVSDAIADLLQCFATMEGTWHQSQWQAFGVSDEMEKKFVEAWAWKYEAKKGE